MKTWKWLLIVLVIALFAGYYILGMDYLKLRRDNTDIAAEIEKSQAALADITATPADMEQRLADAKAELAAAEYSFSVETDDTLVVSNVLKLARDAGVKAIPLSTRPWAVESLFNRNYNVFSLRLSLTGDFTNMQNFIERLEKSGTETLVVKNLKVERAPVSAGDNVTADIEIAVYSLAPAAE